MARVIFSSEYEIKPDKVLEYLEKVNKLKALFSGQDFEYSIYVDKKKNNYFYEMFSFKSEEDFEKYDDANSDEANDIIYQINSELIAGKVHYKTLIETT